MSINHSIDAPEARTPATLEVKRRSRLKVNFFEGDFSRNRTVKCDFRYGTVLLGNLGVAALFLANPAAAGGFFLSGVGIDYLSGNAFECPQFIAQEIKVPDSVASEIEQPCAPTLILPPPLESSDLSLSYALVSEASEFVKRFDKQCHGVVSPANTVAALKRSSVEEKSFKSLFRKDNSQKLVQVLRDTGAIRGVDMKLSRASESTVEVRFSLWDLYTRQELSSFKKVFSQKKLETLKSGFFTTALGQSLRLLPNSFALSIARPQLELTPKVATKEVLINRDSLVGLLSVTSVQHPDQYATWDAGFEITPSLFFDSIHNRVSVDTDTDEGRAFIAANPEADQANDFTGYALTLPIDARVSFHTPAGAFGVYLGMGVSFYKPTGSQAESNRVRAFPAAHFGLDWVAYFSRNLFFQLGLNGFGKSTDEPFDKRAHFGLTGWSSVMMGVGYYFPDGQGYLESLLAKK